MKTIWFENKPKYERGDLVLFYSDSGSFNEVGMVGIVANVSSTPYDETQRANIEKQNEQRRECCGKKSIRQGNNAIVYKLECGKIIRESLILYSGVDKINDMLTFLREQSRRRQERINEIGSAMGLDTWDIPTIH